MSKSSATSSTGIRNAASTVACPLSCALAFTASPFLELDALSRDQYKNTSATDPGAASCT